VLVNYQKKGKSIEFFYYAGFGRTGYIAMIILGKPGIDDPFEYIWGNYSNGDIRTSVQFNQATEILKKPDPYRVWRQLFELIWSL